MKIALCIFGQPRYIENDKIFERQKKAIYSQGDIDVFTHFWFDKSQKTFEQSDWSYSKNINISPDTIKIINNRYSPKKIEYQPQINFEISNKTKEIADSLTDQRFNNKKNLFNVKSQLYSIKRSTSLCQEYIAENNIAYDFIILTRYDVLIHTFPVLEELERKKFYIGGSWNVGGTYPGWNDYIQIFDPLYLNVHNVYDHFDECLIKCESLCIEEMKQIYLCKKTIFPKIVRYIGDNLLSEIVRDT